MKSIANRRWLWIAVVGTLIPLTEAASQSPGSTTRDAAPSPWTTSSPDYGRRIIAQRMSPYRAIGRLTGTSTCAGAVVLHPRIVLTASHCISGHRSATSPARLRFQPASLAAPGSAAFSGKVWAMGAVQHRDRQTVREASEDWAIILLEGRPTGIRPLRVNRYSSQRLLSFRDRLVLPRLSLDIARSQMLGLSAPCSIRGEAWGVLVHDCVAVAGAEGAPLLMEDDVWYGVVGIHSGSMFVEVKDDHSLRLFGNSATRVDRFADSLRALLGKLDAEDDSNGLHSHTY